MDKSPLQTVMFWISQLDIAGTDKILMQLVLAHALPVLGFL